MSRTTPEMDKLLRSCGDNDIDIALPALKKIAVSITDQLKHDCIKIANGYIGAPPDRQFVSRSSIDFDMRYALQVRWDIVLRAIGVLSEDIRKKLQDNEATAIEDIFVEPTRDYDEGRIGFRAIVIYNKEKL